MVLYNSGLLRARSEDMSLATHIFEVNLCLSQQVRSTATKGKAIATELKLQRILSVTKSGCGDSVVYFER
jgi:hypothetical protein